MWSLLERVAQRVESIWLMVVGLAIAAVIAMDRWLYRRYSRRLADSVQWTSEQRDRIDDLQDRIEELETRAERAEAHAEQCEQVLSRITDRLCDDSDVEWQPDLEDLEI